VGDVIGVGETMKEMEPSKTEKGDSSKLSSFEGKNNYCTKQELKQSFRETSFKIYTFGINFWGYLKLFKWYSNQFYLYFCSGNVYTK
jgi:hypothetical protein